MKQTFTAAELEDFRLGVDQSDDAAWRRFKLALERVTNCPQPPKSLPDGWTPVSRAGW